MTHVTECTNNSGKSHSGNCQNGKQCIWNSQEGPPSTLNMCMHTYAQVSSPMYSQPCVLSHAYTCIHTHNRHVQRQTHSLRHVCVCVYVCVLFDVTAGLTGFPEDAVLNSHSNSRTLTDPAFLKAVRSVGLWLEEAEDWPDFSLWHSEIHGGICKGQNFKMAHDPCHLASHLYNSLLSSMDKI
jgi:hypothetical protein